MIFVSPAASNLWPFIQPPQRNDASQPQHPNAAGCLQMCTSINHQHDRRQRWWTGNMRLDKQNNEFQQPEPAMHTLWLLFKHVLIMSPCLQLCKHILTLYSTLCNWNLAESQCWKTGGTSSAKGKQAATLLEGKSQKDGWDVMNYSSPLCMDGGKKESEVC